MDAGPTAPVGTGKGLKQEIFDNTDLRGAPKITHTDPAVNHSWKFGGSPDPAIPTDRFSIRWGGTIAPRRSETHTLTTVSDDNVRVWIDDKLVIDAWSPHDAKIDKAQVTLNTGSRHAIKVEYVEQTGEAHV